MPDPQSMNLEDVNEKVCTKCGEAKPLSEYPTYSRRGRPYRKLRCRPCIAAYARQWRTAQPGRLERIAAQKVAKYHADPESHRKRVRDYAAANPRRARAWHLRAKFGIGLTEYEAMLEAQGGRCAVCRSTESGDRRFSTFAVDHDHSTGRVRGLLCALCNRTLGQAGDNPERLMAMAAYLLQYSDVLGSSA